VVEGRLWGVAIVASRNPGAFPAGTEHRIAGFTELAATAIANASKAAVHVEAVTGTLCISVRDDGCGGADFTRGTGLVGLKDRVEALGGRIWIHSPLGAGTTLRAELPFTSADAGDRTDSRTGS
jgi:signal transduction histidine kinase